MGEASTGRALALAATLGKKLVVVDLDRDHVAAVIALPRGAWSCAWGGWCSRSETGSLDPNHPDPSLDVNLCACGLANGEVLLYDLRSVGSALARIRPPPTWGVSESKPVHAVIPLSRDVGGGVLYANASGVRSFVSGPEEEESLEGFRVFSSSPDGSAARDADDLGTAAKIPGAASCETALAWFPASRTLVATTRRDDSGRFAEHAGLDLGAADSFARHVVREWDPSARSARSREFFSESGFGRTTVTERFLYHTTNRRFPERDSGLPRAMTRIALTGPPNASAPCFIACGASDHGDRNSRVCLTDAVSGQIGAYLEHAGAGEVDDVRGWCGDAPGSVEVLASLGRDVLTVFSWESKS